MKINTIKKTAAALLALSMLLAGCSNDNDDAQQNTDTAVQTQATDSTDETISVYTGKAVENEEDLAIFKFNATIPEGYETVVDSNEGKLYASPNGSITVKAQNFKEEFQDLEIFADQGCASIKLTNMMYQADTEFSEPQKTTVAGFDAIKYDYNITSYIFLYETDANGEQKKDADGNPIITDQKEINGEYVNRIYYFYSDEDVFYVMCEAPKDKAEAAAKEFDEFISSVTITKK